MRQLSGKYSTAAARWAGVGPYYAMFPATFADKVISRYTEPGDVIIDPFSGRGTSLFSAAVLGRRGIGVEINPVGWVYSQAKLHPATEDSVMERLVEIAGISWRYRDQARNAPSFFHSCYRPNVLRFLLAARSHLKWRRRKIDWTAMAFLLINLHGKRADSFSNQMRQTKSMSPGYAVRWWRERNLTPPELDPIDFLSKRLQWRYRKGIPDLEESRVYLGDSTAVLPEVPRYWGPEHRRARLLLTSPPYRGITNYHYDQWLRLWLLGGAPAPNAGSGGRGKYRGKFDNTPQYRQLLADVFRESRNLLRHDAVIYVRTDRRPSTLHITVEVLREVFPKHRARHCSRPHIVPTQTRLFGHSDPRVGEVDLILSPW